MAAASADLSGRAARADDPGDPRRSLRRLRPAFLDRLPALRGRRLCRALHQPARLHRLRPGLRRRHRQDLSRTATIDGPDGAVDAAVASGVADPNNLFVTGGSGGGILTAWIVGKTDRFKAAAAQKPVINWTSMALTADGVPLLRPLLDGLDAVGELPVLLGALPAQPRRATSRRRRSSSSAAKIIAPPISEAEQFYAALKLQGRADDVREGARGKPRRHRLTAQPIGGEGGCDHRLVRPLPDKGAQPVASNEGTSTASVH